MSLVLVALICVAATLISLRIGIGIGRRELEAKKPIQPQPPAPKAICGCGHHLSSHDPADQQCHHKSRAPTKWDEYDDPTKYELVQCACRQYVGPRPIDDLFPPGFLPLDGAS